MAKGGWGMKLVRHGDNSAVVPVRDITPLAELKERATRTRKSRSLARNRQSNSDCISESEKSRGKSAHGNISAGNTAISHAADVHRAPREPPLEDGLYLQDHGHQGILSQNPSPCESSDERSENGNDRPEEEEKNESSSKDKKDDPEDQESSDVMNGEAPGAKDGEPIDDEHLKDENSENPSQGEAEASYCCALVLWNHDGEE